MADEEHRAGIRLQQLLEQLERVDVEVVGRLVEDEHVGRQREQAREQHAVALAARERAQRRVGARRREQEVGEVAHHVLPAARRLDPLAAGADGVGERRVEVERAPHLVEVRDLDARALAHRARGRLELAEDELQERRLAGAVRADQADLVAAQDRRGEVVDDDARLARRPAGSAAGTSSTRASARRRSCRSACPSRPRAGRGRATRAAPGAARASPAGAGCG